MLSKEVRDAAESIGQFYLERNQNDYKKTEREILGLEISKLEVTEDCVTITTSRPGLLIGKRGETVSNLEKFLNRKVNIVEDRDPLSSWLIPYPLQYEDYCNFSQSEDDT